MSDLWQRIENFILDLDENDPPQTMTLSEDDVYLIRNEHIGWEGIQKAQKGIREKTIDEFAENLKEKYPHFVEDVGFVEANKVLCCHIDNIAKKMKERW